MRATLGLLFVLASLAPAYADEPVTAKPYDFMASYRDACHDKIYASCVDQTKVLDDGLTQAKAAHKLAVIVFGFNSCPPCNVLDAWLKSPKGAELMKHYVQIDLSIFDSSGELRPDVFDAVLPSLKLRISRMPKYGVPLFAIVDPQTKHVVGTSILGFSATDQSRHTAYLKKYASL